MCSKCSASFPESAVTWTAIASTTTTGCRTSSKSFTTSFSKFICLQSMFSLLLIIFRDFDAKQLFLAYKTGALIKTFSGILDDTTDGDAADINSKQDLRPVVVPALFKEGVRSGADAKSGGGLMAMIKKDQAGRQARAANSSGAGADSNRFRGVYRVNLSKTVEPGSSSSFDQPHASANGSSSSASVSQRAAIVSPQGPDTADGVVTKATAMIFRNPFSVSDGVIPQVRTKSSKKNLTFSTVGHHIIYILETCRHSLCVFFSL
jgi:hypothetical protein